MVSANVNMEHSMFMFARDSRPYGPIFQLDRKFYAGTGYESKFPHEIKKFMRKITSTNMNFNFFIQLDV
jgi:hypothetical protein